MESKRGLQRCFSAFCFCISAWLVVETITWRRVNKNNSVCVLSDYVCRVVESFSYLRVLSDFANTDAMNS